MLISPMLASYPDRTAPATLRSGAIIEVNRRNLQDDHLLIGDMASDVEGTKIGSIFKHQHESATR
nr:hypothetical protein [uncultured Shinella sp.]